MLKTTLVHPGLLSALATAGHGSLVVLVDANFPAATMCGPNAKLVELAIGPELPTVSDVFRLLQPILPIEAARVMRGEAELPLHQEYASLIAPLELRALDRFAFYDVVKSPQTAVIITTGDLKHFANLMLTVGLAHSD